MLIMEQCQPFLKASIFIGMCVCEEYKGQCGKWSYRVSEFSEQDINYVTYKKCPSPFLFIQKKSCH